MLIVKQKSLGLVCPKVIKIEYAKRVSNSSMSTVTPDQIAMEVSKERAVFIQPWVAAQLSDLWNQIRINIHQTIVQKDKQDRARIFPEVPASAHNQT